MSVARYRRGEHEAVWAELRRCEGLSGSARDEALEIARETMRRVLHNAELLAARLSEAGWKPMGGELRTPPSPADAEAMAQIEQITGAPLPPSLRAFWEIVGGVDLIWDYRNGADAPDCETALDLTELDPLAIDSARRAPDVFDRWAHTGQLRLDLAPDGLHKVNVSGGPPYGVELPFLGADPLFAGEAHGLHFVDYLRLCFRWAGFPGLASHAQDPNVQRFVKRMTDQMHPF
jgi:hypothetical protein